jgi:hypothetical protein
MVQAAGRFFYATAARLAALKFILSMSVSADRVLSTLRPCYTKLSVAVTQIQLHQLVPAFGDWTGTHGTPPPPATEHASLPLLSCPSSPSSISPSLLLLPPRPLQMCWRWPAWRWTCLPLRRGRR